MSAQNHYLEVKSQKRFGRTFKKHDLQNPKNKREILADDKLQPIFGTKKLDMFQMTKAVNKHLKIRDWRVTALVNRYARSSKSCRYSSITILETVAVGTSPLHK